MGAKIDSLRDGLRVSGPSCRFRALCGVRSRTLGERSGSERSDTAALCTRAEGGQVAESGRHEELVRLGGVYAGLVARQMEPSQAAPAAPAP